MAAMWQLLLATPAIGLVLVVVGLASLGGTLGIRRRYVNFLLALFEVRYCGE